MARVLICDTAEETPKLLNLRRFCETECGANLLGSTNCSAHNACSRARQHGRCDWALRACSRVSSTDVLARQLV